MTHSERGQRLADFMTERGPDVTRAEVKAHMESLGTTICDKTYWNYRRRLFREGDVTKTHEANGKPVVGDVVGGVLHPRAPATLPPERDWLSKFVRFALAVEEVGGIEAAERMIRAIKEMPRGG